MADYYFRSQPLSLDAINGLTLAAGVTQGADSIPFYSAKDGNVQKALITNLFGTFFAGTSGFVYGPGGFLLQWLSTSSSSTPAFASWPRAFSLAPYAWFGTATNQVTAIQMNAGVNGVTHVVTSGTPSVRFWAIGI